MYTDLPFGIIEAYDDEKNPIIRPYSYHLELDVLFKLFCGVSAHLESNLEAKGMLSSDLFEVRNEFSNRISNFDIETYSIAIPLPKFSSRLSKSEKVGLTSLKKLALRIKTQPSEHSLLKLTNSEGESQSFWNVFSASKEQEKIATENCSLSGQLLFATNINSSVVVIAENAERVFFKPIDLMPEPPNIKSYNAHPELALLESIKSAEIMDKTEIFHEYLNGSRENIGKRLWEIRKPELGLAVNEYENLLTRMYMETIGIEKFLKNISKLKIIHNPRLNELCDNWLFNSVIRLEKSLLNIDIPADLIEKVSESERRIVIPFFDVKTGGGVDFAKYLEASLPSSGEAR